MKALLMLENGMTFEGHGFGEERDVACEVVFNSAMCGYPELLTDPSYAGQGVVMTYPMIGNYGICIEDAESCKPWLSAFIVHGVSGLASNFRCDMDLDAYLKNNHIPGMYGIDTRALNGRVYGDGPVRIALHDYGVKQNIIRCLVQRGCTVKCFAHDCSMEDMLAFKPDGIMLSNGPGDPQANTKAIAELRRIYEYGIPTFGICLGHQLMALSQGFDTYKLKYGHRGINHPVKELANNRVYITSQNHGFVVNAETIDPKKAEVSFVSMNDGSVEGLTYENRRVFTVQFHPEACGGPKDTGFLFDRFLTMIEKGSL